MLTKRLTKKITKLHRKVLIALLLILSTFLFLKVYEIDVNRYIYLKFSEIKKEKPKFRNWFDLGQASRDKLREGFGENGSDVYLTDSDEITRNEKLYEETGFSVVISDKISVNRSIPPIVHPDCAKIEYLAELPKTSVIVIFHNEVKSVLLRTIHSIINRTPSELLHEVILVNDNSSNDELYGSLKDYAANNFPKIVKIVDLKTRHGLIKTRMEGARRASGEVLVVNQYDTSPLDTPPVPPT
jgi:hypothetical protein